MTLILSGTDGLSDVDGSAATPAIRGTDANTGIFFPAADTIAFAEGGAEVARFDSSGNLGIGTSSPSYKLDVRSSLAVLDGSANIGFYANGTSFTQVWQTFQSPNDLLIKTTAAKYIAFLPNNAEAMRIDSSGALLLNTTTNSLSAKLFVNGSIGAQTTYGPMFVSNENNTDNVGRGSFNFQRGGTLVGQITTTNSTCAYTSVSDYRLKENIIPITDALNKVAQLNPVTYKWKSNGLDGQGFIAHELQEVVPDCVSGEKDAVDADGNPQYQGIDTSFLVATLTAAIQEQQALITDLTARITALEAK
jgi:hypothetical protein